MSARNPADFLNQPSSPLLPGLRRGLGDLHDRQSQTEREVDALSEGQRLAIDALITRFTNEFQDLLQLSSDAATTIQAGDFMSAEVQESVLLTQGPVSLTLAPLSPLPFVPSPIVMIGRKQSVADYAFCRLVSYNPATRVISLAVLVVVGDPGPHEDLFVEIGAISSAAQLEMLAVTEGLLAEARQIKADITGMRTEATTAASTATEQAGIAAGHAAKFVFSETEPVDAPDGTIWMKP